MEEKKPLDDVIGFRILNPWTPELYRLLDILPKEFEKYDIKIEKKDIRERKKVIYINCSYDEIPFELQLWPSLMYYCYEYEHDRIHRNPKIGKPHKTFSGIVREQEHMLQNTVDGNIIIPYSFNKVIQVIIKKD